MESSIALDKSRFLIIDCQTTGMRPSVGHLLEIAWAVGSAECETIEIHSRLIELPEGASIPWRVREITGLRAVDLDAAVSLESVRAEFQSVLKTLTAEAPIALIHYAQFEDPFLRDFLETETLPFELLCTHRLAKRMFPAVPSRNIRGLTGFFGSRIGEIKRAHQHVQATHLIWKSLVAALREIGVTDLAGMRDYLVSAKRTPIPMTTPYEYRVDRAKRLALPDKPGIYKMKDKDGAVLYVGKATSLKDRVNSYFRGKKGRDPRKLEMMAQVWDLEVLETGSALEAALEESDEIKRLEPPYNVSLKGRGRAMVFYSEDFSSQVTEQDVDHSVGPFRRMNCLEHLRLFVSALSEGLVVNVFYEPIDKNILEKGFETFCVLHPELRLESAHMRDHLAQALKLMRKANLALSAEIEAAEMDGEDGGNKVGEADSEVEREYTPEEIADKIERLYIRAAATYIRAKRMTRLLWSDLNWKEKSEEKSLSVRGGKIVRVDRIAAPVADYKVKGEAPWQGLEIADFDRMAVLLSEMSRLKSRA